jgi:hypothetical protein
MLTKEELQERAQLVRIHEGNCRIEHPSVDEANFRLAIMKKLGVLYQLRDLRKIEIIGPIKSTPALAPLPPRPKKP